MTWALINGRLIVTANADGSIPLNSKIVAELSAPLNTETSALLLSAPDLREALFQCVRALRSSAGPEEIGNAIRDGKAALSKAEGTQS